MGCSIKEAVRGDGEATRALISAQFQAQQSEKINALAAEVIELRNEGRMQKQTHDINLNVTNLQNQISNQAQANTQVTLDRLATGLAALTSQVSRQSEVIFNSGQWLQAQPEVVANERGLIASAISRREDRHRFASVVMPDQATDAAIGAAALLSKAPM